MISILLLLLLVPSTLAGQSGAARKATPATRPAAASAPVLQVPLGDSAARKWMRSGWNQDEKAGDEKWVWSQGPSSVIEVPLPQGRNLQMTIKCRPYVYPGSPAQTITVELNGTKVTTVTLRAGVQTYSFPLPKAAVRDVNKFEFRYGYSTNLVIESDTMYSQDVWISDPTIR